MENGAGTVKQEMADRLPLKTDRDMKKENK